MNHTFHKIYYSSHLISVLCLSLALSGCASTPFIAEPQPQESKNIVFGRINVVSEGKPLTWEPCGFAKHMVCPDVLTVFVLPKSTNIPIRYELVGDGSFIWSLPNDDYTIAAFEWLKYGPRRSKSGRIWASFSLPENAAAVYIGTLKITISKNSYGIAIEDDFDLALQRLSEKFSNLQSEPTKHLLLQGEEYQARHISNICDAFWGITCTATNRGVVPEYPLSDSLAFTIADSLQPTLKWQSSSKTGVTYDVIIYEAFAYQKALTSYLPGYVVDYQEGISQPSYKIKVPLKPNAKYFWSVRLRQNDTVSEWSHFGYQHFAFFFIAYMWDEASNLLFNFSTPPN